MKYSDIYKNAPDWNDLPNWANWRTVDYDGTVTYYENKPEPPEQNNYKQWVWSYGSWEMFGYGDYVEVDDWAESLQSYPEEME